MASDPQIRQFLDHLLQAEPGAVEPGSIQRPAQGPVHRVGLALEPHAGLAEWARREAIALLLIHRSWGLDVASLPQSTGVVPYHQEFDRWLFSADNPILVQLYGLNDITPLTWRGSEQVGIIGAVSLLPWPDFLDRTTAVFAGVESVVEPARSLVRRAAFVGAMNDALLSAAAESGVDVYVTGQARKPGLPFLKQAGLGLIAVGHHRLEQWGLRCLGQLLSDRFPGLAVAWFDSAEFSGSNP